MSSIRRLATTKLWVAIVIVLTLLLPMSLPALLKAQSNEGAFSLQVTPSPIVDVIKPGINKTVEFTIRNTGTKAEELKLDLRKFSINESDGQIELTDEYPDDVKDWIKFSDPIITIEPGASFTEKLIIEPPESIGFSYYFSILISRNKEPVSNEGKTKLKGSVAIFTLLAVDRPGADRKFDITEFSSVKRLYEYLPAAFNVKLSNTGNTIVQPYGNIYIQRSPNSEQPISVLKLNPNGSYLLPGITRSFPVEWKDGFPVYEDSQDGDNSSKKSLNWNWANAQQFRFGRYYAKVVAVYNDGQRDIPLEATISFWVIPWKLIIFVLILIIILVVGLFTIIKKPITSIKSKKDSKKAQKSDED